MDDQATTGTRGRPRFRKLRIAWSVAWGVVAVLLVVLWVRSYLDFDDRYFWTPGNAASDPSNLLIGQVDASSRSTKWALTTPYWLTVVATAGFASLPWLPWRFNLRVAWTVAWVLLTVLLCVYWLRSYLETSDYVVVNDWMYAFSNGNIEYFLWETSNGSEPPGPKFPIAVPVIVAASIAAIPWLGYFPRRFSLRTFLVAVAVIAAIMGAASWRVHHVKNGVRNKNAVRCVAEMVVEHLKAHPKTWPQGWADLQDDYEAGVNRSGQVASLDELQSRVVVDWHADPKQLAEWANEFTPFRVIWLSDGTDDEYDYREYDEYWRCYEPNTIIAIYLRELGYVP